MFNKNLNSTAKKIYLKKVKHACNWMMGKLKYDVNWQSSK